MTAAALTLFRRPRSAASARAGPILLLAGLGAIVGLRWLGVRAGLDPLAVGAGFGLALVALAILGTVAGGRVVGWRRIPVERWTVAAAIGGLFGFVLVGITLAGPAVAGVAAIPGLGRPAAPFVPWAAITILVATAEEALLRGALFDRVRRFGGVTLAILVTSAAFALMHVPLYGWHVVPLDFAVGLAFAGLRLAARSVAAPASAHAVADLATWWL